MLLILLQTNFIFVHGEENNNQEPKEELKPELPKATFTGTPRPVMSANLPPNAEKMPRRGPFFVPKGTKNLSFGKKVITSDSFPIIGEIECITDGDKEAAD